MGLVVTIIHNMPIEEQDSEMYYLTYLSYPN